MGNRTAFFALLIFSVKLKQGSPVFTVPKFITIENGNIMGTRQVVGNVICDVFLGIPYAQPPIGRNRFKVFKMIMFN